MNEDIHGSPTLEKLLDMYIEKWRRGKGERKTEVDRYVIQFSECLREPYNREFIEAYEEGKG